MWLIRGALRSLKSIVSKGIQFCALSARFLRTLLYRTLAISRRLLIQFTGYFGKLNLALRYQRRHRFGHRGAKECTVSDKDFFDFGSLKVSFINLDARVDRLQHISKELKNIGLGFASRQPAIKKDNGALGCSLSHLEVISGVNLSDGGLLMVCEDDCQFLVNRSKLGALLIEFQKNPALDVLCLAYNVVGRNSIVPISNLLSVTNNTQTTACYVIKAHMVEPLSKIFSSSSLALESGKPINVYAIDQLWKKLQKTAIFAIPSSRAAQQVESYSDIEGRTVFYGV